MRRAAVLGPGFALAALAGIFILFVGASRTSYPDMFWQIPEGLQILHGAFPHTVPYAIDAGRWVDHEWLYEAALAWCWSHGAYPAFVAVMLACYAGYPLALYATLRRFGRADLAAGIICALAAVVELHANPLRPLTFAYYLFTAETALFTAGLTVPLALVPLAIVWANAHASALLAPALGAIFTLGAAIEHGQRNPLVRRYALGTGLALVATLCTPNGLALWTYALQYLFAAPFSASIDEWQPITLADWSVWFAIVPALAIFIATGLPARRANATTWLLSLAFIAFAAKQRRQVVFVLPALAFALSAHVEMLFARLRASALATPASVPRASLFVVVPFVSLLGALPTIAPQIAAARADPPGPWHDLADLITSEGLHGNIFAPYDLAAYVAFAGLPVRVLVDTHADPFDARVWADVTTLRRLRPGFTEVLDRRRIDAVVVVKTDALAQALPLVRGWKVARRQGDLVAIRRTPR